MLCEHCKMREATVKYVEVVNGVKTEHNLCAHCASHVDIGQFSSLFEGEFPLGKLLSGLLGVRGTDPEEERMAEVTCPVCGTTYENFVSGSRFGCPDCYSVFAPLIGETIRRLQGSERHTGKRPKQYRAAQDAAGNGTGAEEKAEGTVSPLTGEERLRLYQARLKDAVRREDYEEAARLRDEIRKMKEETTADGKMV